MGYLFGTSGTIGRARLWITLLAAQIAFLLMPDSPILRSEEVTRNVFGGTISGVSFHLAPPTALGDWIPFVLEALATLAIFWVVASAVIGRLRAVGWSGYWLFLLPVFVAAVEAAIAANPSPQSSWTGLAFLIALVAGALPMIWGVFTLLFVRGFDDGTSRKSNLRQTQDVSETPAR